MIERDIEAIKKVYLDGVERNTPDEVKKTPVFNLSEEGESTLILNRQLVEKWGLEEWLANFKKEATVSTAGIRGIQNVLYPWDVRFPINQVGVALATIAKVLALKEKDGNKTLHKIAAGEVRYNTRQFVDLITRIQAGLGVRTHLALGRKTMPIWLVSFLIFMNDYDGGEYVTASHAVSSKTATKDLDSEGSQFLPEYSVASVSKIEGIIKEAKENGYAIKLSSINDPLITEDFDGIADYTEYLKNGVATPKSLSLIKEQTDNGLKILFDFGGGSMFNAMSPILENLGILSVFDFYRAKEDPFFYGIGKTLKLNPQNNQEEFFDLSCDISLLEVVKTAGFEEILKEKPLGYVVIMVDPDGDRIVLGQVEPKGRADFLDKLGIGYIAVNEEKIFTVYQPTFGFLMLMDFYMKQLKEAGVFNDYPRLMIKTTCSSLAWDEWAKFNGIAVVNTPVGFKEIAAIMKKTEKQIKDNPQKEVSIKDAFGKEINLGVQPRLIFGGEENGGMIVGPEQYIKSQNGRLAIAMREKSAGEAAVLATAMVARFYKQKKFLSDYLNEIYVSNNISFKFYFRVDDTYYNESEPNPEILKKAKQEGEMKRDEIYSFYLSLSLAFRGKVITLEQARDILKDLFGEMNFDGLKDIIFVTDGVYFDFEDMFVEVRKSGTDAKMRFFFCGQDQQKCQLFSKELAKYKGGIPELFGRYISKDFREQAQNLADKIYSDYFRQGL
ncbi:hypothetical protein COX74_03360 [bacterium (Candidatus Gribaldobacteria) CG_4_10_14_0_2_um_filter_41_16]|uniref:Alpha-D-phosphohexomutase alpha/beta/alpha domain-containing protein n=1 Tax=bacterium (Candidatus Gribaldobacteria) CG_4_10_14_0_2_um_filter_41_16 TaxID=2014265 RepID=A0A2M7VHK3_9BACT|nr:MAG: hypothetical protein COX74_03360 [bacterium (Candidatus Gribaldobacteria) CG_4_10_14_0_2_um_filter_41_16]